MNSSSADLRSAGVQLPMFGASHHPGRGGARKSGKDFENLVFSSQLDGQGRCCTLMKIKNYAKRIPADPGWTKRTGERFRLVEEKSPCDLAGVSMSGRAIFIDCKSLEDAASFSVNQPSIVKPHQIKELAALEDGGAIAGFLVRCGRIQDYRFLWASNAIGKKKPLQWDNACWDIIGPIKDGYGVPLRKLIEICEKELQK